MGNGKRVALSGANTSHGGVVFGSAARTLIEGKSPVRIGDIHVCPIPGHGSNLVTLGSGSVFIEGIGVARLGDVCACGAVIVSGCAEKTLAGD